MFYRKLGFIVLEIFYLDIIILMILFDLYNLCYVLDVWRLYGGVEVFVFDRKLIFLNS